MEQQTRTLPAGFKIVGTLTLGHVVALHQMFQDEWWTRGRSLEETQRAVDRSSINIAVINSADELVGYARVLSDYVFKAFIFDVIVRPDNRGSQLGATIIRAIVSHPSLTDVKHFELYCLPELAAFYASCGFIEPSLLRLMRFNASEQRRLASPAC